jgi:hypothetical protein
MTMTLKTRTNKSDPMSHELHDGEDVAHHGRGAMAEVMSSGRSMGGRQRVGSEERTSAWHKLNEAG